MQAKELYFLRHGATGLQGRYIGATDVPLSRQGREQVRKTGLLLREKGVTKIFCSPLLRCRQTLEELELAGTCRFREQLREIDFGRWEGKEFTEIIHSDQPLVDLWVADPLHFCFPDGESLHSFTRRIALFIPELSNAAEDIILVVAHGGVIRHLICLLLGLSVDNYLLFDVEPGSFCSIRLYPEGGVLTGFNIKG